MCYPFFKCLAVMLPVKIRAGVGFSLRGDVSVADNIMDRVGRLYRLSEFSQPGVLHGRKRLVIAAFQLDADREIIAAGTLLPAGYTGVPGAPGAGDELDDFSVTANEEMARNFQAFQRLIIRVRLRIELIGEQFDDTFTAKFFRRQADGMDHQQADVIPVRPLVAIG